MSEHEFELYLRLLGRFLRLTPGQQVEIADELRDHLEARLDELTRAGLAHDEAIRVALDEFGDAAHLANHFTKILREKKRRFVMRCTLGTVAAAMLLIVVGSAFWPHHPGAPVGVVVAIADDDTPKAQPPALVQENEKDREVREKLKSITMKCEFFENELRDVLDYLTDKVAVDIYVPLNVELTAPITMNFKHTQPTARTILELALRQAMLAYTVRDGIIMICPLEGAQEICVYDCAELGLVSRVVIADPQSQSAIPGQSPHEEPMDKVTRLIMAMVQPMEWSENGGLSDIRWYDTRLVVRAFPDTQREIELLLQKLAAPNVAKRSAK